ncbi:MAG: small ribosomal subunit Rsm22 family protein, partial [Polyangiaceae bacterium]
MSLSSSQGWLSIREALCAPLDDSWRATLDTVATSKRWPSAQQVEELGACVERLSARYNTAAARAVDPTASAKPARPHEGHSREDRHRGRDKHAPRDARKPQGHRGLDEVSALMAARLGFSFARDVPKAAGAVAELLITGSLSIPSDRPLDILDLGAGLGATTWGVVRALASHGAQGAIRARLIDQSGTACELARSIAKHAPKHDGLDVQIDAEVGGVSTAVDRILIRGKASFDLVLMGQVLAELDAELSEPERVEAHAKLIEDALRRLVRPGGAIVVIEPALKTTSRHLHAVRNALIEKKATPFAPCLHSATCPALVKESDWCHEDLDVDLPSWLVPVARAAGLRFEGLSFSYLVLRTDGSSLRDHTREKAVRAVSSLLVTKGKKELMLCDGTNAPNGIIRAMRLDREASDTNAAWQLARRGDLLEVDPAVTSESIRVHSGAQVTFAPLQKSRVHTIASNRKK